jgi:sugar diacid utilization regulator
MTPARRGGTEADVPSREQLSNLEDLLALSLRMSNTSDEEAILRLAGTAVSALAHCRLVGAHLADETWHLTTDADARRRVDVEMQLAGLGPAGGSIVVGTETWAWAYPLGSLGRHFGFLAVYADAEPSPPEQFLLQMLTQQTGVALGNARLHSQQRRQAVELLDINNRLADTVAALERSTAIHDTLTGVAVAGEGQDGIAKAIHELTGFSVAVEDRYGNLRAWAGPNRPDPYRKESPDRRAAMVSSALDAARPIRYLGHLLIAASPRDDVVGILALVDPDEVAGDDARVAIEHGATVLAMELARLSGLAETELRLRHDFVDELLAGTDESSAIARAEALGYDLERPHRAVVVEADPGTRDRDELFDAVRRAARDHGVGTLLSVRGASVVVLSDTDRPWESFRLAVERELVGGSCRVGVGSACDSVTDFPRSYRDARLALRVQRVAGGGRATMFDELGVYRLLAGVDDLDKIDRFVRRWLGELLDYDMNKEASDLITTLGAYLDCGGNYDATAAALSVHRSTVKYRLQRIREISGHDLGSPDVNFNLQLAVRAWRTLTIIRSEAGEVTT